MAEATPLYRGQGWYPRISPDARHVTYQQLPRVILVTLATGVARTIGEGRAPAWLGPGWLTAWREHDLDAQHRPVWSRWEAREQDGWTVRQVEAPAPGVGGNNLAASGGHVAATTSRLAAHLDGRLLPLPYGPYGASLMLSARYLVLSEDVPPHGTLHVYDATTGAEVAHYALPSAAPQWVVNDAGDLGYGYFGSARAILEGVDTDVTVTPWRKEGCPIPVTTPHGRWFWRGTEDPATGAASVIGNPHGSADVLQLPLDGAQLHAVYDEAHDRFVVAGNSPRGVLVALRVARLAPRAPLTMPAAVPPVIPVIGRPLWLWYFKAWSNTASDAGPDYPTYPGLPMNASEVEERHQLQEATGLLVPSWTLRRLLTARLRARTVAIMCHAGSAHELELQGAACKQTWPKLPTLGICDFPMTTIPRMRHIDELGLEVYPLTPKESVRVTETRLARLLSTSPARRVHLVQLAYDQHGAIDYQRLLDHQALCARLAVRFPIVVGIGIFAANRADGLRKYPELIQYHRTLFAGIPGPPRAV